MYDNIIHFYNTYTLNDLYSFIDQLDIDIIINIILSNKLILAFIGIIIIMLFTPIKDFIATAIIYTISIAFIFLIVVLWKNSNMTPTETFISFSVGLLTIVGFFVYTNMIKH